MITRYFQTSFGHKIPIVDGYRHTLPPPRDNKALVGASSIMDTLGAKGPKENDFGIVSDIYQFSIMADWFSTTVASGRTYERMLDVGGSTGLISQLFKGTGRVRHAENIEVLDFREALDYNMLRYYLRKIKNAHKELYSQNPIMPQQLQPEALGARLKSVVSPTTPIPLPILPSREDQVWALLQVDFMQSTYPYAVGNQSHFWNIDPEVPLGLDRYILGDYFEQKEKYDFLLVSTTMQHFSVQPFLEKAYSLLEPGGIIFIWNAYWYWVLIINALFGDFPWGAQRLTWDDYVRYLKDYQPDQVENARLSAEVFHKAEQRYTVDGYIEAGKKAGFKYLAHHRLMPPSGIKNNIGGFTLKGDHGADVQKEVLRDIHCFAPNVTAKDLATQSVFLLFEK